MNTRLNIDTIIPITNDTKKDKEKLGMSYKKIILCI